MAEHDLKFARGLAAEDVKFGPNFVEGLIRGNVAEFGCKPKPSKLAKMDAARTRQIRLYAEHHCTPWNQAWSELQWPCDGQVVPTWCEAGHEQEAAAHLQIGPYFERLNSAVSRSDDSLERYNIMAIVADRLGDKALRNYPKAVVEVWLLKGTSEFLERAQPDEAVGVGWLLRITPFGEGSGLARMFEGYFRRSKNATSEDLRLLTYLAHAFNGHVLPAEIRSRLVERFGPKGPPAPPEPTPNRTDPKDIALLVERVEAYYHLLREQKFEESWNLMALDYRESHTEEEYVRTTKHVEAAYTILGWQVDKIQVASDTAQVDVEERRNERLESGRRQESVRRADTYWVFEEGAWYQLIPPPVDWESRNSVEVPIPAHRRKEWN